MTHQTAINDCLQNPALNIPITVKGWVKTKRESKAGFAFVNLNDGSCLQTLQLIIPNSLENYVTEICRLVAGTALEATGHLVPSQGKSQNIEMQVNKITVIGLVENPENYPIQPKQHSFEYLREVAHLRPRTNTFGAIMRVRHHLAKAIHDFFHEKGFYWIHTPIITASDCEGAGELFRVTTLPPENKNFSKDFFGKPAFLTVSGQLNLEAYCMALSKVYTFSPAFRAENSNTSRHLAEFWMIEPEIAFADLNDVIQLAQELLQALIKRILSECSADLEFFTQHIDKNCISRLTTFVNSTFITISYTEAIEILQKSNQTFEFPITWGVDLQSEHERFLCEIVFKQPITITNYPKIIKSFYMRVNDDQQTVAAMDLLLPGIGELIGGSQREERLENLDQRIQECGLNPIDYAWYRDLRRYGSAPHAGFGMGFERLISYVTGMSNIRDVIPFPRTPGYANF